MSHLNKAALKRRFERQVLLLVTATLLVGAMVAFIVGEYSSARARAELELRSSQILALHKETIFGLLDKYRLMTVMVARRPDTADMFLDLSNAGGDEGDDNESRQGGAGVIRDLQDFSGLLAAMSGASRISLALPDGKIVAQSSLAPVSGIYLSEELRAAAIQGRLGRATIFSSDSPNTYAFAASVRSGGEIVGLVNIEVDLEELESAWALSDDLIFVTDDEGRFIVGNQLSSLLPDEYLRSWSNDGQYVRTGSPDQNVTYLARGENYPHIGWTLNVFLDDGPVRQARFNAMIMTVLVVLIAAILAFILLQRRMAILSRLHDERNNALMLERTVARRTAELRGSNERLRREFEERVQAESALKKAQSSLIQSAKLAAIGQMSTALAHEYNQPLAAIRSYADNARTLLSRNKHRDVDDNLKRITRMTERMAQLSGTLKTFARKPRTRSQPVAVAPLIEEAILLVGAMAKKQKVEITALPIDPKISVMAGQVRLSQVVVNLLSNAIDAVCGCERRRVFISAGREAEKIFICVEDTGPGVPPEDSDRIFDAFFTSKGVGSGLGLGLSIAYNIVHDFGGEIFVEQSKRGGAAFKISLPAHME